MSCNSITIRQESPDIILQEDSRPIEILQRIDMVTVCSENPISQFQPFYFVATQGQTVFTLPASALAVLLCAINGTAQSQAGGDFTISERTLTLNQGVDAGDTVFGVIQVA